MRRPSEQLAGRYAVRKKAQALGIGGPTTADRNDDLREVQPAFRPRRRPAAVFRPVRAEAKAPPIIGANATGVRPLAEAPRYGGVWTIKEPDTRPYLKVFGDHQRPEMRHLHARGVSFYPMNPIRISGDIQMVVTELQAKSKLPANQAGRGTVNAFFQQHKGAIAAVLPKHITADRLLKISLGAVRDNQQLRECTVESLFGAVIKCAELGLEPNTPMQHIHMIPFNVRRGDSWQKEVQVVIGYRGYIELARRSGEILKIGAHEVRKNDEFHFAYGINETLIHRPAFGDRGPVIAYYAVAKLAGEEHQFEVMTVDQVEEIRDGSHGYQQALSKTKRTKDGVIVECNSPWFNHAVEMGRKTVVRRLMKYLPLSIELANAQRLDDAIETGDGQRLGEVLTGEWSVDPTAVNEPQEREGAAKRTDRKLKPEKKAEVLPEIPDAHKDVGDAIIQDWREGRQKDAEEALANIKDEKLAALIRQHAERVTPA